MNGVARALHTCYRGGMRVVRLSCLAFVVACGGPNAGGFGDGAMPVPTIADVDGDGDLDIVVSLKDAEDRVKSVEIYEVDVAPAPQA